jgi:hypothetical protein
MEWTVLGTPQQPMGERPLLFFFFFFFFFWNFLKGLWKAHHEVPAGENLLVGKYSNQLTAATQAR